MPKYAEYPCQRCHQPLCTCYQTPERIAHRNRLLDILTFDCPRCPMTVFFSIMDRNAHIETAHSLVPQPTGVNGVTP